MSAPTDPAAAAPLGQSESVPIRRGWAFRVGERVVCRDDWGPLICNLSIRHEQHPDAVYEVVDVADGGRWLLLRGDDDKLYGGCLSGWKDGRWQPMPGVGGSYLKIAGECGEHCARYDHELRGWLCARCDERLPESAREAVLA